MKNFEKYIDIIFEPCDIYKVRTSNVRCLNEYNCKKCCELNKEWLLEEYVESIKLTHDEYVILKNLDSQFNSIRRENGNLMLVGIEIGDELYKYYLIECYNHLFKFIKNNEQYNLKQLIANYEKEHEELC